MDVSGGGGRADGPWETFLVVIGCDLLAPVHKDGCHLLILITKQIWR